MMSDRQSHIQRESAGGKPSNYRSGNPTFRSISAKRPIQSMVLRGGTARALSSGLLEQSGTFNALLAIPASKPGEQPSLRINPSVFNATPVIRTATATTSAEHAEKQLILWSPPLAGSHYAINAKPAPGDEPELQIGSEHYGMYLFPMARATLTSHGLLCANRRYLSQRLLHPCTIIGGKRPVDPISKKVAAYGVTIMEIKKDGAGEWSVIPGKYNRRITDSTPVDIAGPARGSGLLKTEYSPDGTKTRGVFVNCAYSFTPWRTYLVCERNWAIYFINRTGRPREHARYGINTGGVRREWSEDDSGTGEHARFDASARGADAAEDYRNEPNCQGWILEIDPFDPESTPKKRTAMGRLAHTGAWLAPVKEGHPLVWYMSDDDPDEYIYKFVTKARFHRRTANGDMLDEGTLYAARFNEDGTGDWLALDLGDSSFRTAAAARSAVFKNQADVLVNTRLAADVVGATAMDRPQWRSVHPLSCEVYLAMTDDPDRTAPGTPRAPNSCGHIVRWSEQDNRSFATKFKWDLFAIAPESDAPAQSEAHGPERLPKRTASPA